MPATTVKFFRETDGDVPVLEWLDELRRRNRRAFAKCVVRVERLAEMGHELRRPEADMLEDGIYELRVRDQRVNYRMLYFFHGKNIAILAHALTKEKRVPPAAIELAKQRRELVRQNSAKHTHEE